MLRADAAVKSTPPPDSDLHQTSILVHNDRPDESETDRAIASAASEAALRRLRTSAVLKFAGVSAMVLAVVKPITVIAGVTEKSIIWFCIIFTLLTLGKVFLLIAVLPSDRRYGRQLVKFFVVLWVLWGAISGRFASMQWSPRGQAACVADNVDALVCRWAPLKALCIAVVMSSMAIFGLTLLKRPTSEAIRCLWSCFGTCYVTLGMLSVVDIGLGIHRGMAQSNGMWIVERCVVAATFLAWGLLLSLPWLKFQERALRAMYASGGATSRPSPT